MSEMRVLSWRDTDASFHEEVHVFGSALVFWEHRDAHLTGHL